MGWRQVGMTGMLIPALLAGCAQPPMGPQVQVLPGRNKSFASFDADRSMCQGYASQQVAGQAEVANNRAIGGAVLTTVLGAGLGAVLGGGRGAAIGGVAGAGLTVIIALVTIAYQLKDPIYRTGVLGVAIWFAIGIAYFAVLGRHKLVLSPEEEFAMSKGASEGR